MIRYTSNQQLKIENFKTDFELKLSADNRWVKLASMIPWDALASVYYRNFSKSRGAPAVNARIVIGALLIKHKLNLPDEEVPRTIQENPYMQFFLGLDRYQQEPLFAPSLFVTLRKRLGLEALKRFNEVLMRTVFPERSKTSEDEDKEVSNKGKLKIDATVADQYIKYPNDLDLVNEAKEKTEELIDHLYPLTDREVKPRTYRRVMRKRYLSAAKKKKKSKKEIRKVLRVLLNCVRRNIRHIHEMLDELAPDFPLSYRQQRTFWVIQTLYQQQRKMYDERTNRCDYRIVSIHQPHVRPMVRGKQAKPVEFGSKLGLSLKEGFVQADHLSWEAYNESQDLKVQAEAYRSLTGCYPELIQADKIYATNENRKWCKQRNIRLTAPPKGRPPKKSEYQKRKEREEYRERNHIEGKIGQGKQAYNLNEIRARLKETSESWIGITLFVLNVTKLAQMNGLIF